MDKITVYISFCISISQKNSKGGLLPQIRAVRTPDISIT